MIYPNSFMLVIFLLTILVDLISGAPLRLPTDVVDSVLDKTHKLYFLHPDKRKGAAASDSTLTSRFDHYSHSTQLHLLAIAAYYNRDLKHSSSGKKAVTHLAKVVEFILSSDGHSIALRGGHIVGWEEQHVPALLMFAKHMPEIWNQLSDDTKKRSDHMMLLGTMMGNYLNIDATLKTSTDLNEHTQHLPNQSQGNVAWNFYGFYYYGSAQAANEKLINFDFDSVISKARSYGWSLIVSTFTRTSDVKKAIMEGGTFTTKKGTTVKVNLSSANKGKGLRIPYVLGNNGARNDGDCAIRFQWKDPIPYDPVLMFQRSEMDYTMAAKVVDRQCPTNAKDNAACTAGRNLSRGDNIGKIADTSKRTPHYGKIGMPLEFNVQGRSSPHYVMYGMRSTLFMYSTLVALGAIKPGDGHYDRFRERLNIAFDVMLHRDKVGWHDTTTYLCKNVRSFCCVTGIEYNMAALEAFVRNDYPDRPSNLPMIGTPAPVPVPTSVPAPTSSGKRQLMAIQSTTAFGPAVALDQVAPGKSAGSVSGTVAARHTDTALIVRFDIVDDDYDVTDFTGVDAWKYDSVEVLVDADRSAGSALVGDDRQFQVVVGKQSVYNLDVVVPGASATTTLRTGGYIVDVTLPYDVLRNNDDKSSFAANAIIGFDAVFNNRAGGKMQVNQLFFVYGGAHWETPSTWGTLELSSSVTTAATTTTTASTTAASTSTAVTTSTDSSSTAPASPTTSAMSTSEPAPLVNQGCRGCPCAGDARPEFDGARCALYLECRESDNTAPTCVSTKPIDIDLYPTPPEDVCYSSDGVLGCKCEGDQHCGEGLTCSTTLKVCDVIPCPPGHVGCPCADDECLSGGVCASGQCLLLRNDDMEASTATRNIAISAMFTLAFTLALC